MKTKEQFYDWRKKEEVRYELNLHKVYDADVIKMLDLQPVKRQYILKLIRKDIAEKQAIIDARHEQRKEEKKKH